MCFQYLNRKKLKYILELDKYIKDVFLINFYIYLHSSNASFRNFLINIVHVSVFITFKKNLRKRYKTDGYC